MRRFWLAALIVGFSACSLKNVTCSLPAPPETQSAAPAAPAAGSSGRRVAVSPEDAPKTRIAFLGDSLTAGFGLLSQQAYPQILQDLFAAEGYHEVESINAGMTGDTSAGAARRVEQVLEAGVRILVIEVGGNDALRGLTVGQTHDNIAKIIQTAQSRGVAVMLCGIEGPTNLGEDYRTKFHDMFQELAAEYRKSITFIPFILEGVAGHAELNQPDGIHPNEQGAKMVAELLYPKLRDMVDQLPSGGGH
jgi:acyl-CoA thioesterase-1